METLTMNNAFQLALSFVLEAEGIYSNNRQDAGGETFRGITKTFDAAWEGWTAIDRAIESGINPSTLDKQLAPSVAAFYQQNYWNAVRADSLPWPLSCVVFDCAVNQGPGTAVRFLQEIIDAHVDGIIGPETLADANKYDAGTVAKAIIDLRKHWYIQHAQPCFQQGLANRMTDLANFIANHQPTA